MIADHELEQSILRLLTEKGALDERVVHCEVFGYADGETRTREGIDAERPQTERVLESMFERRLLGRKKTLYGRRASSHRLPGGAIKFDYTYSIAAPKPERRAMSGELRARKDEARASNNIYRDLPKIVVVLSVTDHGPCDMGTTAVCPHCGAEGRYVYSFRCADGTTRGAMKGCLSKFPRHPFAAESRRIIDKEEDYKRRGWQLPSWDRTIKEAISAFAEGRMPEEEALGRVREAQEARRLHRQRRRAA